MYDYLLDTANRDTLNPTAGFAVDGLSSRLDLYMTRYQKQRQRAYDRAAHVVRNPNHLDPDVRDAESEAGLVQAEARISRARGDQLMWIKGLVRNGDALRLGHRTPVDLVASRIDIHRSTARDLVFLAQRLTDEDVEQIREGTVFYVRVLEEPRLKEAGASAEEINRTRDMDIDSVKRVAQRYRKMSRSDERRVFDSQYPAFQPSLDGTHVRVTGCLGAYEGEICRNALNRRGDTLVPPGEPRPDPGIRRAPALTTLCQDDLDQDITTTQAGEGAVPSGRNRREPLLMVVAHDPLVEASDFEQGVAVLAGPRVGLYPIDLIRCAGRTETMTVSGQHISNLASASSIRPARRRAVLARDDGCTIDGCNSVYRLEVHHIIERSKGGDHSPENLTTLCWWHHHVAVHRQGMRIDPQSPPRRRRLLRPRGSCGYQPPPPDPHTLAILRALDAHSNRAHPDRQTAVHFTRPTNPPRGPGPIAPLLIHGSCRGGNQNRCPERLCSMSGAELARMNRCLQRR